MPKGFRAYHLDSPLASSIATLLGRGRRSNLTVVDLGAGKGLYVRFLGTVGLRNVTGYEGVHNIEDMTAESSSASSQSRLGPVCASTSSFASE